ncbi:lysophospholipid acyltransferase family protein [Granulicella rosea]|uniref:lysophospholipid acyltransferase family protein n=1 Tax=Granulicella rosea TaxID=474952 RepID=UPI001FE9BDD7|nr:lysophospholipid acyltransferase family protein [Granulicella rosea]
MPFIYTTKQRIILAVVPRLASLLIRLLCCTLRFEDVVAPGAAAAERGGGPGVYAFWHRSLLVAAYRFRGWKIAILISRSFDGELIARTVELLGFTAIRGSSSRGGAVALRQMAEAYGAGHYCAITADGPRGPAQVAKPGASQLAQLVGAESVGAFYALPDKAWVLKSWDRFLIPKPFSTVRIYWPGLVAPELEAVQGALDRAVGMAEAPVK